MGTPARLRFEAQTDGQECPSSSGQGEIRTPNSGGLSTVRLPIAPLGQLRRRVVPRLAFLPAEGKGFEPSSLIEPRGSSAVRPTVSGYLPNQIKPTVIPDGLEPSLS